MLLCRHHPPGQQKSKRLFRGSLIMFSPSLAFQEFVYQLLFLRKELFDIVSLQLLLFLTKLFPQEKFMHFYLIFGVKIKIKIEIFSNPSGTVVARVQLEIMRLKILEVQLQHIDEDAFITQEWSYKFSYSKPNLKAILISVRFNNVACDLITKAGLYHIGGALGHPVGVRNLHRESSD